jgi:hypothetical protein
MSDTPLGGWWKAKDGKWYPPETHPDHASNIAQQDRSGPPAEGWWQASDGNWYPPETHPEHLANGAGTAIEADSVEAAPATTGADPFAAAGSETVVAPTDAVADVPPLDAAANAGGPFDLTPSEPTATEPAVSGPTVTGPSTPTLPSLPTPGAVPAAGTPADPPVEIDLTDDTTSGGTSDQVTPLPVPGSGLPAMSTPPVDAAAAGAGAAAARASSRRGTFDLVPPEEEPVVAPPPVPGRSLFGGTAPSTAEEPASAATAAASTPTAAPPSSAPRPGAAAVGAVAGGAVVAAAAGAAGADTVPGAPPSPDDAPSAPGSPDAGGPFVTPEYPEPSASPDEGGEPPKDRRKLLLIAGGAAAALLLVVLGAMFFLGGGEDDAEQASGTTAAPTTAASDAEQASTTTTEATTTTEGASSTTAAPASTVPVEIPRQASGTGTATVDAGREVSEPYLALITHDGPGNVAVDLMGADGQVAQQLVGPGVSGQYLGVVPVNFADGASFRSVRFTGDGPWAVTFAVPASAPTAPTTKGTPYRSEGDRVVAFDATASTRLQVDCAECTSPLEVVAWSPETATQPKPLKVEGDVVVVPAGTATLQITAPGAAGTMPAWSITPG